ncbi:hypothetical protein GCM10009555_036540 [Acrocarpospora macrocephala]|uniref:Uncharacterized protein n=1 Tax=Acrocarpospora macrocephala TaxID=150177 RepID=A0A5M3WUY7_9ACTN|nr:hypothetical protein Amac_068120 [Acrocarpospora macrocephala]
MLCNRERCPYTSRLRARSSDLAESGLRQGQSVVIHLIAWKAEPGSLGPDGKPTDSEFSDFVVEGFDDLPNAFIQDKVGDFRAADRDVCIRVAGATEGV